MRLTPCRDRILAILCDGYGADGALGPDAEGQAIPAGCFRPSPSNGPLAEVQAGQVDRAVRFRWLTGEDAPDPGDLMAGSSTRVYRFELEVGYVCGPGTERGVFLRTGSSDDPKDLVLDPEGRALWDAEQIGAALGWSELLGGTDPEMLHCQREGQTTVSDPANGRLIARTTFRLLVAIDNRTVHAP